MMLPEPSRHGLHSSSDSLQGHGSQPDRACFSVPTPLSGSLGAALQASQGEDQRQQFTRKEVPVGCGGGSQAQPPAGSWRVELLTGQDGEEHKQVTKGSQP